MEISIYRFDPDKDKKPYMQDYFVDPNKCKGAMLLDALEYIKEKEDPTLAFRRSCGEGVCGSDGVNMNGKNGLACITRMKDLPDRVLLRPLPSFPVVRDLIVDMKQFYEQYERVEQSPEDRAKLDGLYECILCACCSSSCPSYWWNPDKFVGPAGLLWANRFIVDTRDTKTAERLEDLQDPYSLFRCRGIMDCVEVCPKGLNPTKAIGDIRQKMLKEGG